MDLPAVAMLPFEQWVGEGRCLIKQMDHALQMDLGPVLRKPVAVQIYMLLHHIGC